MHISVGLLFISFFSIIFSETTTASEKAVFGKIDKSSLSDKEYEDYMHQIYLKHYSQPVSDEKWTETLSQISSDTYQLQFKDNLWDLSGKLFQNSLYWSKLWQANSHITNPHRIKFKDSISFHLDHLTLSGHKSFKGNREGKIKTLTSEEIPSSIPLREISISTEISEMDLSGLKELTTNQQAPLAYYLSSEDLSGRGEVVSKEGYGKYSFNGEDIIVRIEGEAPSAAVYTIFKNRGGFKKTLLGLLNVNGYEIAVKGSLKILGFIPETDSLYRARVIESLDSIEKGDQILAGPMPRYTLSQKGPVGPAVSGDIIGAPGLEFQSIHSLYSLVYLNRGLSSNVQSGDVFYIRTAKGEFALPYEYEKPVVGQLKVVHVSEEASTAVIIATREPIHVGYEFNNLPEIFSDLSKVESFEQIEEDDSFESEPESMGSDPAEDPDEGFDDEDEALDEDPNEGFDDEDEASDEEPDEGFDDEDEALDEEPDEDFDDEDDALDEEPDEDFDDEDDALDEEPDEGFDDEDEALDEEPDEDFDDEDDALDEEPDEGFDDEDEALDEEPDEDFDDEDDASDEDFESEASDEEPDEDFENETADKPSKTPAEPVTGKSDTLESGPAQKTDTQEVLEESPQKETVNKAETPEIQAAEPDTKKSDPLKEAPDPANNPEDTTEN